jgi:Spherulation-specific family 4
MNRNKLASVIVILAIAFLASGPFGLPRGAEPAKDKAANPKVRLLVPAYFYPGGPGLKHWDRLIESAKQAPIVAIVNPASGPGVQRDPSYEKVIDRAHDSHVLLIGYVSTSYAKRPLADVKADIDRWYRLYPKIEGVFLDEQASAADQVDYYASAFQHVKKVQPKALVVANPGTVCAEEYLSRPAADVVCLVENNKEAGPVMPAWTENYGSDRFAGLLYGINKEERMQELLRELVKKRIGCVYLTNTGLPNPWDRLPEWWDNEAAAVREANRGK